MGSVRICSRSHVFLYCTRSDVSVVQFNAYVMSRHVISVCVYVSRCRLRFPVAVHFPVGRWTRHRSFARFPHFAVHRDRGAESNSCSAGKLEPSPPPGASPRPGVANQGSPREFPAMSVALQSCLQQCKPAGILASCRSPQRLGEEFHDR